VGIRVASGNLSVQSRSPLLSLKECHMLSCMREACVTKAIRLLQGDSVLRMLLSIFAGTSDRLDAILRSKVIRHLTP